MICSPRRLPYFGSVFVLVMQLFCTTARTHAASGTWTQLTSDGLWSDTANWSGGTIADGSGSNANFNTINITADNTVRLDSARTIGSLTFGDTDTSSAASWTVDNNGNAANTLTGLSTITVNALGAGKTATISAIIAGSAQITKNGTGTLVLSGANTLNKTDSNNAAFAWRLDSGGIVVIASNSAFGVSTGTGVNATTLVNLNGATLQASGSARNVANPIWLSADSTISGSESITFSGTFGGRGSNRTLTNNITGAATLSLTNDVYTKFDTGSLTLTFAGTGNTLISGNINNAPASPTAGNIVKSGSGTLTLSNTASTYTGVTTINAGVMAAAALANGGTASSIGQSTNAASNLVFGAPTATLRYNGSSNASTNRGFTLSSGTGGGATIESSGSGTLTIDNTVALAYGTTGQTRLLTLGGTNTGANTFSKVIADNGAGATSLTKAGAGQWVLGGTNTYTGATNANNGTLQLSGSGAINTSSGITVAGGAKLAQNSSVALISPLTLSGVGLGSRAMLSGTGTINQALTLDNLGDTLSPGNSPGLMPYAMTQSWASFSYDWETNDFTGVTAGTHFDQIDITGGLTLSGGPGSYQLNLLSLTALNALGNVPNFSETSRTWDILTTSTGITGFNAANWTIDTAGFSSSPAAAGTWSLTTVGNNLVLNYVAVPEPSSLAMFLLGIVGFWLMRRK